MKVSLPLRGLARIEEDGVDPYSGSFEGGVQGGFFAADALLIDIAEGFFPRLVVADLQGEIHERIDFEFGMFRDVDEFDDESVVVRAFRAQRFEGVHDRLRFVDDDQAEKLALGAADIFFGSVFLEPFE